MADTLTYLDIAYKILKQEEKARSLHYKVIAKRAFKLGLIESDDLIIAGNISSAINSVIRKSKIEGEESKFISYGKGQYGLTENEPKGIFAEIRDKNNQVKRQLLEALLSMPPFSFEELVGEVLRNLGFENITVTCKSGDGGIDVTGELVVAGAIKNSVCVQVKRWRNNVQRASISELRGSLRPHQTGLFITTSDFSKPSIEEASDPYKAPISLINGKEFVDILCNYGIGVTAEEVIIYDIDDENGLIDIPGKVEVDEKGIEIFTKYKGQEHYAIYFSPSKVIYNNEVFKSPSAAGTKVQNGLPVNGWKFWKFIDEKDGKTYPIDRIREK
ncbi:MAG: restriction endonuclease [Bacteroidetes bacterium]|nr:restriction endonuclease [Bacteroidota bacterium]